MLSNHYHKFRRAFRLPADADEDNISALHKDGVLTIRAAKIAPNTPEPKKIKVAKHQGLPGLVARVSAACMAKAMVAGNAITACSGRCNRGLTDF